MKKHVFLVITSVIFLSSCSPKIEPYTNKWHKLATQYELVSTVQFYSASKQDGTFTPYSGPKDSAYTDKKGKMFKVDFAGGEFIVPAKTFGITSEYQDGNVLQIDYDEKYGRLVSYEPESEKENANFQVKTGVTTIDSVKTVITDEGGEEIITYEYEDKVIKNAVKLSDGVVYKIKPTPYILYFSVKSLTEPLESVKAKGKKIGK